MPVVDRHGVGSGRRSLRPSPCRALRPGVLVAVGSVVAVLLLVAVVGTVEALTHSTPSGSPSTPAAPTRSGRSAARAGVATTTVARSTTTVAPRPAPPPASTTTTTRPVARPATSVPSDVPTPNPRLTPGAIQSSDTGAVCTPGWASAHRDVSESTKDAVAAEYGLSSRSGYEIDHLIPLEIGGSNSVANLWPEPYDSSYGAIEKDGLEDWLHEQVCDGSLALAAAQHEIAQNWYATWLTAGKPMPSDFGYSDAPPGSGTSGGSPTTTTTPSAGAWCTASASPSNDGYSGDYEIHVHSNQPYAKATASDSSDSWSRETDGSGYADIRLYYTSAGESVTVRVGNATCSTTA